LFVCFILRLFPTVFQSYSPLLKQFDYVKDVNVKLEMLAYHDISQQFDKDYQSESYIFGLCSFLTYNILADKLYTA
jgi:hypothetical protein